eukprot:756063-Hanusia_phi.AAC.2
MWAANRETIADIPPSSLIMIATPLTHLHRVVSVSRTARATDSSEDLNRISPKMALINGAADLLPPEMNLGVLAKCDVLRSALMTSSELASGSTRQAASDVSSEELAFRVGTTTLTTSGPPLFKAAPEDAFAAKRIS